jgi:hypothetical protein
MRIVAATIAVAILGLGLGVAACKPLHRHVRHDAWGGGGVWSDGPMSVPAKLTCPDDVGDLTRVSAAPDGKSCEYADGDRETVSLSMLPLNGQTPQAALAPAETALTAVSPTRTGPTPVTVQADSGDGADRAKVDVPGVHVDAHGDEAHVNILGITINAKGKNADIHADHGTNSTSVLAGPGGATIRVADVKNGGAHMVFILAGERPSAQGYRSVGYIATGPAAGPLVVAQFKSRFNEGGWGHGFNSDDRGHDIERLLRMNVRG